MRSESSITEIAFSSSIHSCVVGHGYSASFSGSAVRGSVFDRPRPRPAWSPCPSAGRCPPRSARAPRPLALCGLWFGLGASGFGRLAPAGLPRRAAAGPGRARSRARKAASRARARGRSAEKPPRRRAARSADRAPAGGRAAKLLEVEHLSRRARRPSARSAIWRANVSSAFAASAGSPVSTNARAVGPVLDERLDRFDPGLVGRAERQRVLDDAEAGPGLTQVRAKLRPPASRSARGSRPRRRRRVADLGGDLLDYLCFLLFVHVARMGKETIKKPAGRRAGKLWTCFLHPPGPDFRLSAAGRLRRWKTGFGSRW